jgi:hypothetical protein
MRRRTRRFLRVTVSVGALLFAAASVGCANDPVSPDDWLREHTPPVVTSPPTPPPERPTVVYAVFMRATQLGNHTFMNGCVLTSLGEFALFSVDDAGEYDQGYATGDYTLTDSTIVLRFSLFKTRYEVSGLLRGDTLRLAYPDALQSMHPVFSEGDYVLTERSEGR